LSRIFLCRIFLRMRTSQQLMAASNRFKTT
jgi:hypothetical protein